MAVEMWIIIADFMSNGSAVDSYKFREGLEITKVLSTCVLLSQNEVLLYTKSCFYRSTFQACKSGIRNSALSNKEEY